MSYSEKKKQIIKSDNFEILINLLVSVIQKTKAESTHGIDYLKNWDNMSCLEKQIKEWVYQTLAKL